MGEDDHGYKKAASDCCCGRGLPLGLDVRESAGRISPAAAEYPLGYV
jgi:hypothetical protein